MEILNFNRSANKWRKRFNQNHTPKSSLLAFVFLVFFSLLLFISSKYLVLRSPLPFSTNSQQVFPPQCSSSKTLGEKFLWYAPHSGFSNQLSEFKTGILMAAILNRTLIVPPILDHHAVALGSCPKFRVLPPNDLRFAVWNHSIDLFRTRRYVSMADIVDLSALISDSTVRLVDFRAFMSSWCGSSIGFDCSQFDSIHQNDPRNRVSDSELILSEKLRQCGLLLSGYRDSTNNCVHAVDEDCRTTVWTYKRNGEDGVLDSFQPDDELKKKKKISFVRKRRDVYRALGPGSEAESATVLAFGSLFTAWYKGSQSHIDIHEAHNDRRIQSVIQKIEFLPFVPEILKAGKDFARRKIKAPFFCSQLRLLDGQFKNHWQSTFLVLKQKLESLRGNGPLPVHIFLMTDLPMSNWTGSYLGDLLKDSDAFKIFVLREDEDLVVEAARRLVDIGRGKSYGTVSTTSYIEKYCDPPFFPDTLLYIEESVCSCASLGFVGTAGSTIAESIELMRKYSVCSG